MLSFFKKLFVAKHSASPMLEEQEKAVADAGSEKQRMGLALNERTSQEVLYYMALQDPSDKVRKAVAQNNSTPMQAVSLLAKDKNGDVRYALARRLVKILPELSEDMYSQLYAFAVQALGELALDEVLKVRKALAETLKDQAGTPPAVALQLAKDLEREVSAPILRFCTALSDDALVEVIETHPAHWASEAVAQRKTLSDKVSRAVIEKGSRQAGTLLLKNEGADISDGLLEIIIDRAREYPEWHKPIATRKALPPLMALKLAAYVDKSVRKILTERSDLDAKTIEEISRVMQRRIDFADSPAGHVKEDPMVRARRLQEGGGITEEILSDAIAMRDQSFVCACIALLAKTKPEKIENVLQVRAAKSICAVCWRAGLSMRFALHLQQTLGNVPAKSLIYPRGGSDYPFTSEEMEWQLDVIGI